jgi:hypothetical protein
MNAVPRKRVLFRAGKIQPKRRDPKPCNNGYGPHEGHMLPLDHQIDPSDELAYLWADIRTCSKCGSSVSISAFRKKVA